MSTSARASLVLGHVDCTDAALTTRDIVSPVLHPSSESLHADYAALDSEIKDAAKTVAGNLKEILVKLRRMQQLLSQRGEARENSSLPTWTKYYERFRAAFNLEMSLRTVQRKFREMDGKPKALPAPKSAPLILSAHDRRRLVEAAAVGNEIVAAWEQGGNVEAAVLEYKKIAVDSKSLNAIIESQSELIESPSADKDLRLELCSRGDTRYQQIRDKHYVPNNGCIGLQAHFLIWHREEVVGIISGASAVYTTADRDNFFGLIKDNRADVLPGIVNNTVFRLDRTEPNLATRVLALWREVIAHVFYMRYGRIVYGFETFVEETNTRKGALYKADNWTFAGRTAGSAKIRRGIENPFEKEDTTSKLIYCKWRAGFTAPCSARAPEWARNLYTTRQIAFGGECADQVPENATLNEESVADGSLGTEMTSDPELLDTARHEAGHAVVAHHLKLPIEFATIVPKPGVYEGCMRCKPWARTFRLICLPTIARRISAVAAALLKEKTLTGQQIRRVIAKSDEVFQAVGEA